MTSVPFPSPPSRVSVLPVVLAIIIVCQHVSIVVSNRFQNGLMLGYILNMKARGSGGGGSQHQPDCHPSWEFGNHPEGLGWKLKENECKHPEDLIVQVFKKNYHLDTYQAKQTVKHAKSEKKAVTLLGKALEKLPCPFKGS